MNSESGEDAGETEGLSHGEPNLLFTGDIFRFKFDVLCKDAVNLGGNSASDSFFKIYTILIKQRR